MHGDFEEMPPAAPTSGSYSQLLPQPTDNMLGTPQIGMSHNSAEEAAINMDWYELFYMEGDDVMGLAGSLSNPDYLNPQNLEFLYRFL
jgi:hypothetical protein